jgi:hypothetical protein
VMVKVVLVRHGEGKGGGTWGGGITVV